MVGQEIRNEDEVHLTNANWTLVGWLEWLVVWSGVPKCAYFPHYRTPLIVSVLLPPPAAPMVINIK